MNDSVLIIDFGSQVTQLIARRLREAGVYTEILPCTTDPQKVTAAAPRGIILSGGAELVAMADTPRAPQEVFDLNVPGVGDLLRPADNVPAAWRPGRTRYKPRIWPRDA